MPALNKRLPNRDKLLRHMAMQYFAGMNLELVTRSTWESSALLWFSTLHDALMSHPHVTALISDYCGVCVASGIDAIVSRAVRDGIPPKQAVSYSNSLLRLTINDAAAEVNTMLRVEGVIRAARAPSSDSLFAETMRLLLDGITVRHPRRNPPRLTDSTDDSSARLMPQQAAVARMSRADEEQLAWDLVEVTTSVLSAGARAMLFARIGSGDYALAIRSLLEHRGNARCEALPTALAGRVMTWVSGYEGSGKEAELHRLINRISRRAVEPSGRDVQGGGLRSPMRARPYQTRDSG